MSAPPQDSGPPAALGSPAPIPAFYKRRKKRGNEIGQVLLRKRLIIPEHLREALRIQQETGGLVGAILIKMGACDARAIADALIDQARVRDRQKGEVHAVRARENPSIVGLRVLCRPGLTLSLLVLVDAIVLFGASALAQIIAPMDSSASRQLLSSAAMALVTVVALAMGRLYSMSPPSPPEEIRRSTGIIAIVYFGISAIVWLEQSGFLAAGVRRRAWLLSAVFSMVLVPLGRGLLRTRFAKRAWWGHPVVVLGAGKLGRTVVGTLQNHPELGLKPVAILDDDPSKQGTLRASWGEDDIAVESIRDPLVSSPSLRAVWGRFSEVEGVPVVGGLELAPALAQRLRIRSAVVAMPEMESSALVTMLERVGASFTNLLVVPNLLNIAHFGAPAYSLGGVLGIEVRRQLLLRWPRLVKRTMDIGLTVVGGLMLLPVLLLLALLIRLDSPGAALYRQKRLGQDGVRFQALKFRTMYGDGEQRLAGLLANDSKLRVEYEQFHKLTVDPRVTRVGRILRKYSLDELPQIWNVLRGDMSVVGPRPYLEREIPDMNHQEIIILRVKPGITGIWQVTERNATAFEHRVQMDFDYVRNWSPWLDIYVIARTVLVVVGGTGS